MIRDDNNTATSAPERLASPGRLLVFAVLLPGAVAASNQFLFESKTGAGLPWLLYPWLIFTTAVLSWCAGRYLQPAWFRWILFAWCLVLLDALTILACMTGRLEDQFGYVLVSAQISLLVLWALLGTMPWQWRLPAIAALAPLVIMYSGSFTSGYYDRTWNYMMFVAAPIVAVLCGGLRFFGFKLRKILPTGVGSGPVSKEGPAYQFGMKHMLIWLTVSGPLLLFMRSLDIDGDSIYPVALVAMCVATVNLISIWAVLGGGHWIIRVASIVGLPFLIAHGMTYYSAHIKAAATTPTWRFYGTIPWAIGEMEDYWIAWLWLDAALLAALLLFLRASGYRLMRRPSPRNPSLASSLQSPTAT